MLKAYVQDGDTRTDFSIPVTVENFEKKKAEAQSCLDKWDACCKAGDTAGMEKEVEALKALEK